MTIKIVRGTVLQTNNYIVGNEKNVVIIDASAPLDKIKQSVAGRKVLAILLTHGHWDHIQTLSEILTEYDCAVYMYQEALNKINGERKTFLGDKNPQIQIAQEKVHFINDSDELTFGDMVFKVLATPGHTNCSMSYILEDKQIIFTGDTLFKDGIGRDDLPTGSAEQLSNSLTKLLSLSNMSVYPGHGESTNIEIERENFLKNF